VSFINLIWGYYENDVPIEKKLLSDENSDVVVYLTGHSGVGFFKIQDTQIMYADDIADAVS